MEKDAAYCHSCGAPAKGNIPENPHQNNELQNQVSKQVKTQRDLNRGTAFVTLGWVFFGLSFLIIPLIFSAGAFIMGFLVYKNRSETHGVILMVFSIVGAVLGFLIGMIVASFSYLY